MDNPTEDAGARLPATLENAARLSVPALPRDGLTLLDAASFERALELAKMMADAKGLPGFYSRSPGTCLAAIEDALRLGISPFVVARNSYQAKADQPLSYYGKFVTAVINGSPAVDGILDFEHIGPWHQIDGRFEIKESKTKKDENGEPKKYAKAAWTAEDEKDCGVIVRGRLRDTGEIKELPLYLIQCWPRNSTLWGTDPRQQICYVAARRWADRHAPHILMGINLAEEMPDMIEVNPEDRGPGDVASTQRPTGTRLEQFRQLHGPKADAQPDKPTQAAQDASGTPPAQGQGNLGLASDRAPAGGGAAATGQAQQPSAGDPPKSPTMVDLFLPGQKAGESLPISAAGGVIVQEAAGKDRAWLEEVQKINPWIQRHRSTREAIWGLAQDLEEGGGQ